MRVLGAILAGGQSRRFGSDKATALLGTQTLFERVVDVLGAQTDGLVVCGREVPGITCLADRPAPGFGPLAGLNAALHYAHKAGFDAVLCVPIDVHPLPYDLRTLLDGPGAKVLEVQHAVGFWPVGLRLALDQLLAQGDCSFRSWIHASGAKKISEQMLALSNINRPKDLRRIARRLSSGEQDLENVRI